MTVLQEVPIHKQDLDGNIRERTAVIIEFPVAVPDDLTEEERTVLMHLKCASDALYPIFLNQVSPQAAYVDRMLARLEPYAEDKQRKAIDDYRTLLRIQHGFYDTQTRRPHLFDHTAGETLDQLVDKAAKEMNHAEGSVFKSSIKTVNDLLTGNHEFPPTGFLYPDDISNDELQSLGDACDKVDSLVVRTLDGKLKVVPNAVYYKDQLTVVIDHLKSAYNASANDSLREYILLKIRELTTGLSASRDDAVKAWIRANDDPNNRINFILSTGLECYTDRFRSVRGISQGTSRFY